MRVRIDLKIIVFLILFLFTNQISVYLTMLIFCTLHEFGHIIAGLILKLKPENLEILPYGLSISFKLNPDDINKKIKKRKFIRNKENDCCIIRTNAKFDISYNFFIHKLHLHFFIDLFYILGTSGQAYIYLFSILLQSAFSLPVGSYNDYSILRFQEQRFCFFLVIS